MVESLETTHNKVLLNEMTAFRFLFVFGWLLLPWCDGKVSPPPDGVNGTKFICLPGSTVKIKWSFDDTIGNFSHRSWAFQRPGENVVVQLAQINVDDPIKRTSSLLDFDIEKPATLVLNNMNQSYNGTYIFSLSPSAGVGVSKVVVSIVVTPIVTFNCANINTLFKGDNFTCECKGQGGNPPANVAWNKDGVQNGKTEKKQKTLSIINFGENDRGKYTCKAQSHVNATDEKSIELDMYFKPTNTDITISENPAVINMSLTILCTSKGFPKPKYAIHHNDTKVVSTDNRYFIRNVKRKDAGTYKCVGSNFLGNDSDSDQLKITRATDIRTTTTAQVEARTSTDVGLIVGTVVGAVLLIVLVVCLVVIYRCNARGNVDVNPNGSRVITNHYELEEDHGEDAGANDTVKQSDDGEGSQDKKIRRKITVIPNRNTSKEDADRKPQHTAGGDTGNCGTVKQPDNGEASQDKKSPGASLPPVYASVNKDNRPGNTRHATSTLYGILHHDALKGSKKKQPETRNAPTEYASIDFIREGKHRFYFNNNSFI